MSVYRSGGDRPQPTRALLCERCAAVARIDAERDTFTCAECSHEQPVSRADLTEITEIRAVSSHPGAYRQLDDFARTIGAPSGALSHTVKCDGLDCHVSIELNSGTPCGLELTAATRGFPEIRLTRETDEEVYAKERGVTREVQTGDARFDARVFIDSDAVDADVLAVLEPPAVRAAITLLLDRYKRIRLHAGGVAVTSSISLLACCEPDDLRQSLGALRVLAGAPRPLTTTTTRPSTFSRVVSALALSGMPVGVPLLIIAGINFSPLHTADLILLPAVAGFMLGGLASWPLGRIFRGRSTSHRRLAIARFGMLLSVPIHAMTLAILVNGLLDRSPERTDVLSVVEVSHDSDESDSHVTARSEGSDLGTVTLAIHDPENRAKAGQQITVYSRKGALGARWTPRDARLDVGGGVFLFGK